MIKLLKKIIFGALAAFASIAGFITNGLQFIRNLLVLVLEVPNVLIKAVALLIGIAGASALIITGENKTEALITAVAVCVILFVLYKLFSFIYTLLCTLLIKGLKVLDFDSATQYFVSLMQKSILKYMDQLDDEPTLKSDQVILFGIPFLLHKINWFLAKTQKVLSFLMYPLWIGAAIFIIVIQLRGADVGSSTTSEWIIALCTFAGAVGIAAYIGRCFARAIQLAGYLSSELDELYAVYAEFFRNVRSDHQTGSRKDNRHKQESADHSSDNPYYIILAEAKSAAELKRLYREHSKKIHPDVCQDLDPREATQLQALLNEAYAELQLQYQ